MLFELYAAFHTSTNHVKQISGIGVSNVELDWFIHRQSLLQCCLRVVKADLNVDQVSIRYLIRLGLKINI